LFAKYEDFRVGWPHPCFQDALPLVSGGADWQAPPWLGGWCGHPAKSRGNSGSSLVEKEAQSSLQVGRGCGFCSYFRFQVLLSEGVSRLF
jgi:hypothetical protein